MTRIPVQRTYDIPIIPPALNERVVVATAGAGMLLSTLDTGIMNVALPSLGQAFHTSVTGITWAIALYIMALSSTILLFGRLSDRYGRARIFTWGLLVFTAGSLLCGFAFSVLSLVLFRALQGLGAAMVQATAAALITTLVAPERRGAALGILGVLLGLGPVLGPVAGGLLLSAAGWRWIFWVNLPICLAGLWGCRALRRASQGSAAISLDVLGGALLLVSLLALLWGLALKPGDLLADLACDGFLIALVAFALWELRARAPMLDLRLLRRPALAVPLLAILVLGAATAVAFIVPPYFLEQVRHVPPWQVGFISLSAPAGIVLLSRFAGGAINKVGTIRLMVAGLAIMTTGMVGLCFMQSTWGALALALLLLLYGLGAGIFLPANIAAVMSAVGKELQGTIGATQRLVQNVGIAIGEAVPAALIAAHAGAGVNELMVGFRLSWLFAGAIVLLSLICFVFVRQRSSSEDA